MRREQLTHLPRHQRVLPRHPCGEGEAVGQVGRRELEGAQDRQVGEVKVVEALRPRTLGLGLGFGSC